MNRTEIISDLIQTYDKAKWYTLRANIEEGIYASGKSVNVYHDLPDLLGKTYYTIADIWNHEKKFILYDVCSIANFLGVNVYTLLYPFDSLAKDIFLRKDMEYKQDTDKSQAQELYMQAEKLRKNSSKEFLIWNLRNIAKSEEENIDDPKTWKLLASKSWKLVMDICGDERETVRCWLTAARKPRIPMADLCKLATELDVDLIDLLSKKVE